MSVAKGVLCYLISNQLIALGIFPTNKTHFGQKLWRGPTKTPRKIVPAALAGAGEQHFSEFSWLEAIGLGGARWSKLCQELVPAANLSTNTRLLSSWTWFKISCEGQLGNHHHHQPGVRWCEIEVICPEMTHLVAHISISVAILTLLPGDHLDMCKWSELKIFEIVGSSAGVVKYLGFLSNWSHHSVGTTPQKH